MCLKKLLCLAILCGFVTTGTYSQPPVVAGKITPSSGQKSIEVISVSEKGATRGVITEQGSLYVVDGSPDPTIVNNANIIKVQNHSYVHRDSNWKIDDISILSKRIALDVRRDGVPLLSTFNEETTVNGSWNDINYSDNNPANWQPSIHWDRILKLAIKFSETGNVLVKDNIVRAIKFWDERKPVAGNYWWNAIGVPLKIGKTLVLMGNQLPVELQHAALKYMELGIKKDFYDYHGKATGQNLVWLATVHLMMGVVRNDTAALARAFKAIYSEVKVSGDEGIQFDFSFHQHGTILYSGGYGLGFATEICKLVNWSHGTAYQFPVERINIICSYILDGQQWMIRNQTIDYSSTGREISRFGNYYARAKSILQSCKLLIALNVSRKNELQLLADRLDGTSLTMLSGSRYFWKSDFLVHHTPKFYSSVKMSSSRTKGSESGNNENLQGYYLGQGIQFIMRTGKEYEDIFPVWDWQKLPGLLSEQKTDKLPLIPWGAGAEGKKSFAGGVSDGQYGLAAYDYVRNNVSAKRGWFYFDDEIVCLGAAITCATDNSLFQTINQNLLRGDVLIGSERMKIETLKRGVQALKKQQWIYHDSTAYFPGDSAMLSIKSDVQTGNWRTINNNHSAPDLLITKSVFSAWIDLGKQAKNKSYSYTIVPGISISDAQHYNHPVKVLVNDSTTQAVWHQKLNIVEAAFYHPGEIKFGDYVISVNKPVLLLARDNKHELTITLANPENKYMSVVLTVNRNVQCDNCSWSAEKKQSSFSIELPSGNEAGKSVSKKLIKKE